MYITYNGIASTSLGITSVMRVARPVHPGGRPKMLYVAGRDGILDFGQDRDVAYIITRLFLPATDKRAQLRQIAAWLNQQECKQLIFSDEPDKFYLARPSAMVNPEEIGNRVWLDIVWVCPDPYAYALTTKTSSPNEGTAPTPVIIAALITDDTDHLQITLGDQYIRLETDLVTGDKIVIDTAQGWVELNGLDARQYVTADSDLYLLLPVGAFTLAADGATLKTLYRERWL